MGLKEEMRLGKGLRLISIFIWFNGRAFFNVCPFLDNLIYQYMY